MNNLVILVLFHRIRQPAIDSSEDWHLSWINLLNALEMQLIKQQ